MRFEMDETNATIWLTASERAALLTIALQDQVRWRRARIRNAFWTMFAALNLAWSMAAHGHWVVVNAISTAVAMLFLWGAARRLGTAARMSVKLAAGNPDGSATVRFGEGAS